MVILLAALALSQYQGGVTVRAPTPQELRQDSINLKRDYKRSMIRCKRHQKDWCIHARHLRDNIRRLREDGYASTSTKKIEDGLSDANQSYIASSEGCDQHDMISCRDMKSTQRLISQMNNELCRRGHKDYCKL